MASISSESSGTRRIQFTASNGSRKTVRLGKVTVKQAESFKVKVEALISANITGSMDDEVSRWVVNLDDKMHARLAAVGLLKSRTGQRAMLGAFIDQFLASRTDLKPNTIRNVRQLRARLVECFGESCDLRTIGASEAEDFRQFLLDKKLGENTIRRDIGRSRQLFKIAIRRGYVQGINPFEGMAASVRSDKARQFFVTSDMAAKVLDACPDAQWKLLFALSRYGGLRCPSETLSLKWSDVDWEHNRIRVPSPKTEHLEGKDCRIIPLFPELRQYLLDAFEQAEEGAEYVIARYRDRKANLRTHLERIIIKAGLKPWPKLWHNLRATRQTELAQTYPIHAVCQWIGNSIAVAQEFYLSVPDVLMDLAVGPLMGTPDASTLGANPTLNPTLHTAKPSYMELRSTTTGREIRSENAMNPSIRADIASGSIPPRGVEHTASYRGNSIGSTEGDAISDARPISSSRVDGSRTSDLNIVVNAWPTLAPEVRETILAAIRNAAPKE